MQRERLNHSWSYMLAKGKSPHFDLDFTRDKRWMHFRYFSGEFVRISVLLIYSQEVAKAT